MPKDGQVGVSGTLATTKVARKRLSSEVTLIHRKDLERQPCRDLGTGTQTKGSARAKAAKWEGVWQVQDHLAGCHEQRKIRRGGAWRCHGADPGEPFRPQWEFVLIVRVMEAPESETHSFIQPLTEYLLQAQTFLGLDIEQQ